MLHAEGMPTVVAPWMRIVLVAGLGVPQLITGLWAVFDPSGWFENYPGLGPALVAAEPPYNAHLATDAGAGFLATGVLLIAAAWWGQRGGVLLALATYGAFALPHFVYHLRADVPDLGTGEQVWGALLLAVGLALASAVTVAAFRSAS